MVNAMKRIGVMILILSLSLGLLLPSFAMASNNMLIMRGPGGGGGRPQDPPPPPIEYYTDSPEDKWAVCIGISDYEGRSSDLWNPHNDATEMALILKNYGYNYALAMDGACTAVAIYELVDWLVANEGPNSEVVFFYSGHGGRIPDSYGFDTDVEADGYDECLVSWDSYGLPDSRFGEKFSALESNHVAMIFASCHSGGMFDEANEVAGPGRVCIAAAEADQYGWDYLLLENTLFFYHFGDQALLNGPYSTLEDAFWYARPLVIAEQPDSCPIMDDQFPGLFYVK